MDQQERLTKMKAAIIDFVAKAYEIPYLKGVVLFGSVLEGDVNKKSDIDLLLVFDCPHNPETGKESKKAISIGGDITYKYNIENNFSFVVVNKKDIGDTDEEFLQKVTKEGIVIWQKGGFLDIKRHPGMQTMILLQYTTKGLSQTQERNFLRKLYGYQDKPGLADQYARKIGKGVLLIESKLWPKFAKLLDEASVNYKKEEIVI